MLFDLKGRRRRVVQVTYVGLALLMGGGLVLFGIGGEVSGGLVDAFGGGGSGGSDSDIKKDFEKRVDAANKKLATAPKDPAALADLMRANFQLARLEANAETGELSAASRERLGEADSAWTRYLETNPQTIDPGLVSTAFALYDQGALNDPAKQLRAARIIAEQQNTVDAYVSLVNVATRAGDTRIADLAERKAVSLAVSKDDKAAVKEQIKQIKSEQAAGAGGGTEVQPPAGDG